MSSWTCSNPGSAAGAPAEELAGVLATLQEQLSALTRGDCAAHPEATSACLERLYRYLVDELTPILHAVHVRIRPALRRLDATDHSWRAAVGNAALLRLSERVALLRAEYALAGGSADKRAEIVEVTHQLADVAAEHLALEQRSLPALLSTLSREQAERIVDAARRTAHDAAESPRLDLAPAGL